MKRFWFFIALCALGGCHGKPPRIGVDEVGQDGPQPVDSQEPLIQPTSCTSNARDVRIDIGGISGMCCSSGDAQNLAHRRLANEVKCNRKAVRIMVRWDTSALGFSTQQAYFYDRKRRELTLFSTQGGVSTARETKSKSIRKNVSDALIIREDGALTKR